MAMDKNNNNTNNSNSIATQTNAEFIESVDWPYKLRLIRALHNNIWPFSVVTSLVIPLMFLTIYSAAVFQNHVEPILPWISDSGSVGLQAAFFSQFIDLLCVLMPFIAFLRYRQLEHHIHVTLRKGNSVSVQSLRALDKWNFIALLLFGCSVFLLIIPGNFRSTEWLRTHMTAAVLGFTCTYTYAALLVYLSNQMANYGLESRPITLAICTVTGSSALLVLVATGIVSILISPDIFFTNEGRMFWNANQPGYCWHLASNIAEWIFINMYSAILICNANRLRNDAAF